MIFGYLSTVLGAALAGGLTLVLSLCDFPLWLNIIVYGAAAPLYALFIVIYLGGFGHAWKDVFGKSATDTKDA